MIVLSDPEISRIPVEESGEALIDLRTIPALRLDPRMADPDGYHARLRLSVVDRLITAQTLLRPGLRLLIVEGFRPVELQAKYFDAHVDRLRTSAPGHDEDWYRRQAGRHISPPEFAPHPAGAAVDLTLCETGGHELWLGTEVNDTGTDACHTAGTAISAEARGHRRLLGEVLTTVGLVNYPGEWWHWSYGDRYWAHMTGALAARYGPVAPADL
ncbi:D-alanyl-D-alanine dipeptidase [Sphaerisporangium krabiense]|uniref:D-alanyl-D-alanine dipeptidase n=1 Tax=Sphaerisporangium krabiense TaxID=763782 RepID=A0A7W9DMT7_9ACTN|nr:M15 family metallopeptidase [Sphaerisporangium krabiense]MBB5624711.1 D-alanyl-D-alanine dipeptidase [Sphaerisporangium krabiense]GII61329.1 D-alanyl-D-alanine dipeptidase [Sphaerisporangium krabiense]